MAKTKTFILLGGSGCRSGVENANPPRDFSSSRIPQQKAAEGAGWEPISLLPLFEQQLC
ncbi:MAG TPA: hypothetical protein VHR86_07170 [Armatimonadota bacterium]|nr:hypothetical protein [Armatimonadota bacterium]